MLTKKYGLNFLKSLSIYKIEEKADFDNKLGAFAIGFFPSLAILGLMLSLGLILP